MIAYAMYLRDLRQTPKFAVKLSISIRMLLPQLQMLDRRWRDVPVNEVRTTPPRTLVQNMNVFLHRWKKKFDDVEKCIAKLPEIEGTDPNDKTWSDRESQNQGDDHSSDAYSAVTSKLVAQEQKAHDQILENKDSMSEHERTLPIIDVQHSDQDGCQKMQSIAEEEKNTGSKDNTLPIWPNIDKSGAEEQENPGLVCNQSLKEASKIVSFAAEQSEQQHEANKCLVGRKRAPGTFGTDHSIINPADIIGLNEKRKRAKTVLYAAQIEYEEACSAFGKEKTRLRRWLEELDSEDIQNEDKA